MAGGKFTTMDKVVPGVYINDKSEGGIRPSASARGTVAICKSLSWGATGVVQPYVIGDDPTPIVGANLLSDDALFLREMAKGSDTTPAPRLAYIYRPLGTSGVKASAIVGALTATGKYIGTRGNDITIVISADPDNVGYYDIVTVVDGDIVDSQYIDDLDNLVDNDWVDFSGTGTTITTTAGTALTGGVDPTISATDHADFMTAIEPYTFDVVIYDGSNATVASAYTAFARRVSENIGRKCQAVMGGASTQNSEYAISALNGVTLADGTNISATSVVYWLGGAEAACPYNQSLTSAQYPGAVSAYPKKTDAEVEAAIKAGYIVFVDEFGYTKVCKDINTLTSFTVEKHAEYSKNRVIRTLFTFENDMYKNFALYYIGKTNNNETGRALFKAWIVGYLSEMQANNGVQKFTPDAVTVSPGNTSDSIVVDVSIMPVDSVEIVYATVNLQEIA